MPTKVQETGLMPVLQFSGTNKFQYLKIVCWYALLRICVIPTKAKMQKENKEKGKGLKKLL
jgi:hypothetical protein